MDFILRLLDDKLLLQSYRGELKYCPLGSQGTEV